MEKIIALFNRQVIIAILVFTASLCLLVFLMQLFLFAIIPAGDTDRFQVMVTPAEMEDSANQVGTVDVSTGANPTPTLEGVVEVGMQAVVSGTQGRGVRMRQYAGFDAPVNYLAQESEQVKIIDGPLIEDGYVWWKLLSLDNPIKIGWTVQDFLLIE